MAKSPDIPRQTNLIEMIGAARKPVTETDDGWIAVGDSTDEISPAFQNSWANAPGGSPMSFFVDENGVVRFRGDVVGGTPGTVIFTLPEGFRPEFSMQFSGAGVSGIGNSMARIRVDPNGDVTIASTEDEIGWEQISGRPGEDERVTFFTNTTAITAGQNLTWSWTYSTGSAALLDLSDPFGPVILESGIYAISATMLGTARTSGQTATITLDVGSGALQFFAESDFPLQGQPNSPTTHFPAGTATGVWYIPAGQSFDAIGWHSNATNLSFKFFGYVQRIS